ncbi:hypothetical protein SGCOL_003735 [Colletotrichum sp. CLE4]
MRCSTFLALAASVSSASGHYFFPHLIANGNFTGYYEYVRDNSANYMPFKNGYDSTDLRCRTGSMEHAATTGVYKVKAGDEVGFGLNFGGSIQHPGPMQAYLSKAPGDVREYEGDGDWFKIFELGPKSFSSEGIEWGVTNVGNFTFKLPEETPAGQYLLRIEHIGVHGAGDFGGAEFYFNCAQIEVESSSTAVPGPTVKIPGLYDGHEPGIEFYMYRPWIVNFTMPGPARWPQALVGNVTAEGVSVAPTATPWTLSAVTSTVGGQDASSSAAVVVPTSLISAVMPSANATFSYASTPTAGASESAILKSKISELVATTSSLPTTLSATAAPSTTAKKSRCPPRSTVISTVYVTASA